MRYTGAGWVDHESEPIELTEFVSEGSGTPEPSEEDTRERRPAKKDMRSDKGKQ